MMKDDVPPYCPACDRGNAFGYEVQGEYDGVLLRHCQYCKYEWPRFDPPGRLYNRAMEIIEQWRNHAASSERQPEPELGGTQ
jgi:hypothetical protein